MIYIKKKNYLSVKLGTIYQLFRNKTPYINTIDHKVKHIVK
jgi:hypothetical protein